MANIDPGALAKSLRHLDINGHDVGTALTATIHACIELFGVAGSGLMLADETNDLHYVTASDETARRLETVQTEIGEGPCVDAFFTSTLVATKDLTADTRWPNVRRLLMAYGIRAVLGVPVRLGGVPVGSLDVYQDHPHEWDDSERIALIRYSDVIETTLTVAAAAHRAGELADQLQFALDYRVAIERATGFLMAERGLTADDAFGLLRRTARNQRRKVTDVAHELLTGRKLPTGQQ